MSSPEHRETAASRRAHAPDRDPRDIVTEYAFRVDPGLLGVPLAGPFRRAFAMLADLVVVAFLFPFRAALDSLLGGWVDFAVAAAVAWLLFRMASGRGGEGRQPRRFVRVALRAGAVVILLVGTLDLAGSLLGGDGASQPRVPPGVVAGLGGGGAGGGGRPSGLAGLAALADVAGSVGDWEELATATSPGEARSAARRLARRLRRAGVPPDRIADVLAGVMAEEGDGDGGSQTAGGEDGGARSDTAPGADGGRQAGEAGDAHDAAPPAWARRVARQAVATVDSARAQEERRRRATADSLAPLYVEARAAGDSAAADSLREALRGALAGGEIEELEEEADRLEEENDRLEDRVEELESATGFLRTALDRLSDDLGVGVGTLGLYFVLFLALWDGRTPGKRLLGTRVVKLDGRPVGWWDALGRFGGLAAGPATGFLGWAQVFWDPNRQAIHDRFARTVVIRTRGPGKRYEPGGGE